MAMFTKTARLTGMALSMASVAPCALALPELEQVTAGEMRQRDIDPKTREFTTSDRASATFRNHDIAADERVVYVQPSASSIMLARIDDVKATEILGQLEANGRLFLINPHGVLFGETARVDVGGLLATSVDIDDANFAAGRFTFDRPSDNPDAAVINKGEITIAEGGFAALVAPHVRNDGLIVARLGAVTLGSTKTFAIDFHGDDLIKFGLPLDRAPLTPDGEEVAALVDNSGDIIAEGGRVVLGAKHMEGVIEAAVNTDGLIRATSVEQRNGKIILSGGAHGATRVGGTLDASGDDAGETGGKVDVRGETVTVASGAEINASGEAGGGEIKIGGDYKGQGDGQQAQNTVVEAGAVITANALDVGDGGRVIVWADDTTRVHGEIAARGGAHGGDGGFVETSGKQWLDIAGASVSAAAPLGQNGEWLLDPKNLFLTTGGAALPAAGAIGFADPYSDPGPTLINIATITAALAAGTDVSLQANNNIAILRDIIVPAGGAGGSLSLTAGRSITQTTAPGVTIDLDSGDLNVRANAPLAAGVIDADRDVGDAEIDFFFGPTTIVARDVTMTLDSGAGLTNATVDQINFTNVTARNITVNDNAGGLITVRNTNITGDMTINSIGTVSLPTVHNIDGNLNVQADRVESSGLAVIHTYNVGGDINFNVTDRLELLGGSHNFNAGGAVDITAGDIYLGSPSTYSGSSVTLNGPIDANPSNTFLGLTESQIDVAAGDLTVNGTIASTAVAGSRALNLNAAASAVDFNGAITGLERLDVDAASIDMGAGASADAIALNGVVRGNGVNTPALSLDGGDAILNGSTINGVTFASQADADAAVAAGEVTFPGGAGYFINTYPLGGGTPLPTPATPVAPGAAPVTDLDVARLSTQRNGALQALDIVTPEPEITFETPPAASDAAIDAILMTTGDLAAEPREILLPSPAAPAFSWSDDQLIASPGADGRVSFTLNLLASATGATEIGLSSGPLIPGLVSYEADSAAATSARAEEESAAAFAAVIGGAQGAGAVAFGAEEGEENGRGGTGVTRAPGFNLPIDF